MVRRSGPVSRAYPVCRGRGCDDRLRRYSLVTPAGDGLVLVHRLVQAITRAQLSAEEAAQRRHVGDRAIPRA